MASGWNLWVWVRSRNGDILLGAARTETALLLYIHSIGNQP